MIRSDRYATAARLALTLVLAGGLLGAPAESADPRLESLLSLRVDRFPFEPPATAEAWAERSERVRRQVQVAAGLWPPPPRPEPTATFHKRVERDGYTVEAVSLQSYPGHYVTGSLYRPSREASEPRPGVLCPHGHWGGGRFHRWDDDDLQPQLASGAERFDVGGRHPLQARCVQLARMGCVVFLYDMLGYGDSRQIQHLAIHAPSEETLLDGPDNWGFYSTQAELRMQGPLGVQAFNSQCAFDWLQSLPDVDPDRVGVTGGSSGATQTLMLSAVDERPVVAFPVVMVSTAMQGGCGCENACCLRIDSSNVEIAALMAPKPLGMASADDWTRNFANDGWPEMQRLYKLLGVPNYVTHASLVQYPHNYNHASRAAMYPWLKEHLGLPESASVEEQDFLPLTESEASIDPDRPFDDRSSEVELMRAIDEISKQQLADLTPSDAESLDEYRRVIGGAYDILLCGAGRSLEDAEAVGPMVDTQDGRHVVRYTVQSRSNDANLPAVAIVPEGATSLVVVASQLGVAAVIDSQGEPTPIALRVLESGAAVLGVDTFALGSLAPADGPLLEAPVAAQSKPIASHTYGYNPTPLARRAADLLAAVGSARTLDRQIDRVSLLAVDGSAPFAAAALSQAGDAIHAAAIDSGGFRFDSLTSWRDPDFLPGAVKYGDLPGLLALAAPRPVILVGEAQRSDLRLAADAYSAAGEGGNLLFADAEATQAELVSRLLEQLAE